MNMTELNYLRSLVDSSILDERVLVETTNLFTTLNLPYSDELAMVFFGYAHTVAATTGAYILEAMLPKEELQDTVDNILAHFGDDVIKNLEKLLG